jgi:exodeoxyribonuclease VII large subunit
VPRGGRCLEARFNPVAVRGEITGFRALPAGIAISRSRTRRARSAVPCSAARPAAGLSPRDGELVEVRGRLGVYEQRGDLQLVVESMQRAGQGLCSSSSCASRPSWRAKACSTRRKRPLPVPRGIGLVTSPGAAALHDVVTACAARAAHPGGAGSGPGAGPRRRLRWWQPWNSSTHGLHPRAGEPPIDVILLVRGGGSMEDLWAFNDEQLARTIVQSPVPLVSGVGHETDFTIADFCADLRAPTPTAAAELVAQPRDAWLAALDQLESRVQGGMDRWLDRQGQRLDLAAQRLGRPSGTGPAAPALRAPGSALRHAVLLNCSSTRCQGHSRPI